MLHFPLLGKNRRYPTRFKARNVKKSGKLHLFQQIRFQVPATLLPYLSRKKETKSREYKNIPVTFLLFILYLQYNKLQF